MTEYQKAYFKWVETREATEDMDEPYHERMRAMEVRMKAWDAYVAIRDAILRAAALAKLRAECESYLPQPQK